MLIRIKIEKAAMNWVNILKNPIHIATPELIIAKKPIKSAYNIRVINILEKISDYLADIIEDYECNKMEIAAAIIEFHAFRGVNLKDAMQIVYFANQVKEIYNGLNLNREHILNAVLYYHSKQNLSATDVDILKNIAQFKRGIKRNYKKHENFIRNN